MPLTPGTRIGPFEVVSSLGAGGMGEVYRAHDSRLGRDVAVKLLPAEFSSDPDRLARFQREAQVLAALNHPHIAVLYGVEESAGQRALVLELVEGPTLAQRIAAGPMGLDEALPIARQIAEALEAAHERGVIHRDLKPANIKVTHDGNVKVLDFGLAAISAGVESAGVDVGNSPTLTLAATRAGVILGTAAYMAPEQAAGKVVDKRADVWSFGVVLWEMLAGHRLFDGETISHTLADVLRAPIDLSPLPADTPPFVRELLRRCLDRNPATRLRDIGEARIALGGLAGSAITSHVAGGAAGVSTRPSVRHVVPWVAAAVLITVGAAAGVWAVLRKPEVVPLVTRSTILFPEGTRGPGAFAAQTFALSPDGRQIAATRTSADGQRRLWVRPTESLTWRALRGTEGAVAPFWSPDSQSIGFATTGRLQRVEIAGGLPVEICPLPGDSGNISAGTWASDGTVLYSTLGSDPRVVFRVPLTGGKPVAVTHLDAGHGELAHVQPSFLPDGRHFLYYAGSQGEPLGLYVGSLDSTDRVQVHERGSRARYAAGHLFFTRDNELVAQPFNLERFALEGEAVKVADAVDIGGSTGASGAFSVSASGVVLYQAPPAQPTVRLEWFDSSGKLIRTLGEPDSYEAFEVSPDGQRTVAQVSSGDPGDPSDLWIFDNESGIRRQFTSGPASERRPVWSPDSKRVMFVTTELGAGTGLGGVVLHVKSIGANDEETIDVPNLVAPLSWSRDDVLLFLGGPNPGPGREARGRGGRGEGVFSRSLSGSQEARLYLASRTLFAVFSRDGKWVAYTSNESGPGRDLYVSPFPGPGEPQLVSSGGGIGPQWRDDGRELFFVSLNLEVMAVDVEPAASRLRIGKPHSLFPLKTPRQAALLYSPSPDGKRFLVATTVGEAAPVPLTLLVRNW